MGSEMLAGRVLLHIREETGRVRELARGASSLPEFSIVGARDEKRLLVSIPSGIGVMEKLTTEPAEDTEIRSFEDFVAEVNLASWPIEFPV
jgi:hypothetical protein